MPRATSNEYLKTKVLSASPAQLRLMLLDGAVRFATRGRDGLAEHDYEKSYDGLSQAKAILIELINALRPEVDPELCENLSALYTFMYKRLVEASLEKSPAIVDEVITLLQYERETWSMLIEQLARENRPATTATPADATNAYTPLSVEG